jgi:lysophospholipase L1-like esterase
VQLVGLIALTIVTVALVVAAAVVKPAMDRASGSSAMPVTSLGLGTPTPTTAPIRFAAVGDSITAGDSPNFSAGRTGSLSWVTYAAQHQGLVFAGGWAEGGSKTEKMVANIQPVKADVLVIIAGTNDFGNGVPFSTTTANLDQIVKAIGAPRIVISSVPPRDHFTGTADAYNAQLEQFVKSRGWTWVDAAAGVREGNHYKTGLTIDGTHPTTAAAKILGDAIAQAIQTQR